MRKGYRPEPLAPNIVDTIRARRRPFTSFMNQDAVNSLNRRFGATRHRTKPIKPSANSRKSPAFWDEASSKATSLRKNAGHGSFVQIGN